MPPGSPRTKREWLISIVIFAIVVWILWAMGAMTAIGFPGLARAENVEKRLNSIEAKQDLQLMLALGTEVCRIYYLRMGAQGLLLQQLNQSFDEKQRQYEEVAGARYPVIECTPPQ